MIKIKQDLMKARVFFHLLKSQAEKLQKRRK